MWQTRFLCLVAVSVAVLVGLSVCGYSEILFPADGDPVVGITTILVDLGLAPNTTGVPLPPCTLAEAVAVNCNGCIQIPGTEDDCPDFICTATKHEGAGYWSTSLELRYRPVDEAAWRTIAIIPEGTRWSCIACCKPGEPCGPYKFDYCRLYHPEPVPALWNTHNTRNGDYFLQLTNAPDYTHAHTIRVSVRNPLVLSCPPPTTLDCHDQVDPSRTGYPSVISGGPSDFTYEDSLPSQHYGVLERTWKATERDTGVTGYCVQRMTILPVGLLVTPPPDVVVDFSAWENPCDALHPSPSAAGEPSPHFFCGRRMSFHYTDIPVMEADGLRIERTWTGCTGFGDCASATQIVTVGLEWEQCDVLANLVREMSYAVCPEEEVFLPCDSTASVWESGGPYLSSMPLLHLQGSYIDTVFTDSCGDRLILREWGGTESHLYGPCNQTIHLSRPEPQILCPEDVVLSACPQDVPELAESETAMLVPDCPWPVELTHQDVWVNPASTAGGTPVLERHWIATTDCGLESRSVQQIAWEPPAPLYRCSPSARPQTLAHGPVKMGHWELQFQICPSSLHTDENFQIETIVANVHSESSGEREEFTLRVLIDGVEVASNSDSVYSLHDEASPSGVHMYFGQTIGEPGCHEIVLVLETASDAHQYRGAVVVTDRVSSSTVSPPERELEEPAFDRRVVRYYDGGLPHLLLEAVDNYVVGLADWISIPADMYPDARSLVLFSDPAGGGHVFMCSSALARTSGTGLYFFEGDVTVLDSFGVGNVVGLLGKVGSVAGLEEVQDGIYLLLAAKDYVRLLTMDGTEAHRIPAVHVFRVPELLAEPEQMLESSVWPSDLAFEIPSPHVTITKLQNRLVLFLGQQEVWSREGGASGRAEGYSGIVMLP